MIDLSGKRILVVEEEKIIALVERDILELAGCDVVGPVHSFEEANRLIATSGIDAAVVDGMICGVPAYAFADELRRTNIPFVIATAGDWYRPRGTTVQEFRDAVIVEKPISDRQLIEAVAAALDRRVPTS